MYYKYTYIDIKYINKYKLYTHTFCWFCFSRGPWLTYMTKNYLAPNVNTA